MMIRWCHNVMMWSVTQTSNFHSSMEIISRWLIFYSIFELLWKLLVFIFIRFFSLYSIHCTMCSTIRRFERRVGGGGGGIVLLSCNDDLTFFQIKYYSLSSCRFFQRYVKWKKIFTGFFFNVILHIFQISQKAHNMLLFQCSLAQILLTLGGFSVKFTNTNPHIIFKLFIQICIKIITIWMRIKNTKI